MKTTLSPPRLYLAGLVLLALLSAALRSRPGYVLAVGDVFFIEPRPAVILERDPYLWSEVNAGVPSTNAVQLPYRLWWAMAGAVGIPAWLFQTLERGLYLAGAGLAMYWLAQIVWPQRKWAPVGASAFYMFNIGRLLLELVVHLEWLYVLLPLLLALYLRFVQRLWAGELKPALRYGLALAALVALAFPVVLINLPQAVIIVAGLAVVVVVALVFTPRRARASVLGVHALVGGLVLVLSAWWLWPTVQYYVLSLSQGEVTAVTNALAWSWTHFRSSFLNELLLMPQWSWNAEHVPFLELYATPIMRALLLTPMLAAAGAFWAARSQAERRMSLLLYGLLLLLLFLGKGLHAPASYLNQLAYAHVPGFWLMREPWGKLFSFIVLTLALLIGLSIDALVTWLSGTSRRPQWAVWSAVPLLSLFPLTVFPLFVRDILYQPAIVLPSPQVRVPDYWYEAAAALPAAPESNRILLTPANTFYSIPYTWGGYFADGLSDRLLPIPTLSRDYGYLQFNAEYPALITAIYAALEDASAQADPTQALAALNVRYVLVRGDYARGDLPLGGPIPDPRVATIRARLQALPSIEQDASFGPLELYRLRDDDFLPRVYAANHLAVLAQPADLLSPRAALPAGARPIYLSQADASRPELGQAIGCQPRLSFEQINPTRYEVQVEGGCPAYLLVFATAFDTQWQATVTPAAGAASTVPETRHLRANAYANAWHIQQAGPHTVTLAYRPQRMFSLSLLVSLLGAVLLGVVLWLTTRRAPARRTGARP